MITVNQDGVSEAVSASDCAHADRGCGGCAYRGVPYARQLAEKDATVRALLEATGITPERMDETAAAPRTDAYRNKMDYTFGDACKGGEMTLGMHRRKRFMSVLTTDDCRIVHADFNRVLAAVLAFARERGYTAYHKKTHVGLLRHLVLRRGERTGELLVNPVVSSQGRIDEAAFTRTLLALEPSLEHRFAGILLTTNDRPADTVSADSARVLHGDAHYGEIVAGLRFRVGAFSFFQTNTAAAERLYETALSWIPDVADRTIFDLYSGTGTIAQILAKDARRVVGIEIVPEAAEAARENARVNGLSRCAFVTGDVLEALRDPAFGRERPDVIVLDPPRAGIPPKTLAAILAFRARAILYISCNPRSMTENLRAMTALYAVERFRAFDNFPFTRHIEAAALLTLRNGEGKV